MGRYPSRIDYSRSGRTSTITTARVLGCGGSCEECTLSLSGHLATLRWSLRTRIVVIVASTAFICDCRDVRLLLLGQLKLPQLPKTNGERLQKLVLEDDTRQRGKRRVTCTGVTRTLTARDFELELDCSKRRFLSLT